MEQTCEELLQLWDQLKSEASNSSLTVEVDTAETHTNLSTPSTLSDIELPSPLSPFSPGWEETFSFDWEDLLNITPFDSQQNLDTEAATCSDSSASPLVETSEDSTEQPTNSGTAVKLETEILALSSIKPALESPTEKTEPSKKVTFKRPLSPTESEEPKQKVARTDRPPTPITPRVIPRVSPRRSEGRT